SPICSPPTYSSICSTSSSWPSSRPVSTRSFGFGPWDDQLYFRFLNRENSLEARRANQPACSPYLEELPGAAQPTLPDPLHQLSLQHEVPPLLLLAQPQRQGRLDQRRAVRSVPLARSDREPQSLRRRALPPA